MKTRLFLVVMVFITGMFSSLFSQLNGTYTIGGTNPNYTTISEAVTALNASGISGNVTFNIRPGVYSDLLNIQSVPGNNASRTILFKSENNDSSSVVISNATLTQLNYRLVNVGNTQNVQFSRLTIAGPQTGTYGVVLSIFSVPGFKLQRCRVSGIVNAIATTTYQDVVQLSGNSSGYEISNCTIRGGYRAVAIYGGETVPVNNVVLQNNRFYKCSNSAIKAQFGHSIQVNRNLIDSCGVSGFSAIQLGFCSTAVVSFNRLNLDGGIGLSFTSCYSTNAARAKVYNNFVAVSGSAPGSGGVFLQDMRFADVYYNSFNVQVFGSYQVFVAQLSNGGTGLRIQNNSFVTNSENAIVNNIGSENAIEAYSHNNLFNGLPQPNLPPNSISYAAGYASASDLHLIPSNLNAKGTPVNITTDIDGQIRNASTPDIGADEFTPNLRSAGINQLLNPSPDSVYCSSMPLTFELINSGSTALSSVQFEVDFNGTLSSHMWNGTLASGQMTVVDLGDFQLIPLAANNLIVTIVTTNGLPDEYSADDVAFFYDIFQALSGEYTLGGSTPSFNSFSAAVLRLQQGGVCGPVTIKVRNGSYFERIYLNPVKGASASNFIMFEGESQDSSLVSIISSGTSSYPSTVRLIDVSYMGFKHMTIIQNGSTSNYAAFHSSYGNDIRIHNCVISGYTSSSSSASDHGFVAFPDSNLTITHSVISGGSITGCNLGGTGSMKYNLIFEYNTVYGGTDDGLDVRNWTHASIKHNNLYGGFFNTTYAVYGLGLIDFDFSYNKVAAGGAQGSSALYLINNGTGNLGVRNRISNNVLSCNLGVDVIAVGMCMRIISTNNTDIFHNTVRHNSLDTDNFAFNISNSSGLDIRNNIFANAGTGITMAYNNISNSTCDYNVYYTGGNVLIGLTNDIAAVQTITGGDEHSIVANPNFYSTQLDSMFFTNPLLENMSGLCDVTDDMRGFPRQIPNPDPGAFESPSAPNVNLGSDTATCGGIFILDGTTPGAQAYLWNTEETTAQIEIVEPGEYILTATNAIGSSSDTILIAFSPVPQANAGADTVVCYGDAVVLQSNGSTCTWYDAGEVQLSNACYTELPVLENTQIILEVTNDFGCSARDSIEVFLFQSPNAVSISQAGDYLICTEIGTYSWYLDGVLLVEETNDTLAIQSEGSYNLVLNADGPCALQSNSIDIVFTNMESIIQSAPKLVRVAELTYRLEALCSNCMYSILSTDGKLISYSEKANETLRFPQAGIYFIEITQNGYRKVYRIGILN
jgi:hypothetical protein